MTFPHGETITVIRRGEPDEFGDRTGTAEHTIAGCAMAPRSSQEGGRTVVAQDSMNTVVTGLTLYGPYGADIEPTDVIRRSDGTRWHVIGEVGSWKSPLTGWAPGIEVALERVTG